MVDGLPGSGSGLLAGVEEGQGLASGEQQKPGGGPKEGDVSGSGRGCEEYECGCVDDEMDDVEKE